MNMRKAKRRYYARYAIFSICGSGCCKSLMFKFYDQRNKSSRYFRDINKGWML